MSDKIKRLLSDRVKNAREASGIPMTELARRLKTTRQRLYRLEITGDYKISTLMALAKEFEIPFEDFLAKKWVRKSEGK